MLILVIDQDEEYAEIIAESLRRDSHHVVIAKSADAALRFARRGMPDMAVLSVTLPDGSGLDVAAALRQERDNLPVIFLSNVDRPSDILACFEAGADDYIKKPFHPSEFIARVRAVARRASPRGEADAEPQPPGAEITGHGLEFDVASEAAYLDGTNLGCTRLEFEILREMAAVEGQVLSHAFLNERVWHYPNLRDGTLLKGHISSIRRKLRDAGGNESLIRTVHGVGYSLAPIETRRPQPLPVGSD